MSDDYKTLRVPEDAWTEAKEQKEGADRTWGEQIVRPETDETDPESEVAVGPADHLQLEAIESIREQLDRIESSAETAEQRAGSIERMLEGMR